MVGYPKDHPDRGTAALIALAGGVLALHFLAGISMLDVGALVHIADGIASGEVLCRDVATGVTPSAGSLTRCLGGEIEHGLEAEISVEMTVQPSMAAAAGPVDAAVELNDRPAGVVFVEGSTPEVLGMTVKAELLREGLNRLVLRYVETVRLSRRHREAAVRFYGMHLTRY